MKKKIRLVWGTSGCSLLAAAAAWSGACRTIRARCAPRLRAVLLHGLYIRSRAGLAANPLCSIFYKAKSDFSKRLAMQFMNAPVSLFGLLPRRWRLTSAHPAVQELCNRWTGPQTPMSLRAGPASNPLCIIFYKAKSHFSQRLVTANLTVFNTQPPFTYTVSFLM